MIELILIIVFIIASIFGYINNQKKELDKNEKIILDLKRKLSGIDTLSRVLIHSDYGMGFLLNGLSILKDLRNKQTLQIGKELLKFNEPRLDLLQFKEQKEKLRKIIKLLEWDDLISITFMLLSNGIKVETDWSLIIENNFDPEFSYLPGFELGMNDDMEIDNIGSIGKGIKQSALKIDIGMLIPREYTGSFDGERLYAFNYAQYLIFQYILKKNSHLFDTISTTSTYFADELDDLYDLLKKEPSKERFELTIDIREALNEIPNEIKENKIIYISGKYQNIFDAIVEQKNKKTTLPEFLKEYGKSLITLYVLQFIGSEADNIWYVSDKDLSDLREILKGKRKKIEYEKKLISTTGDEITIFVSGEFIYINGAWKNLKELHKKIKY